MEAANADYAGCHAAILAYNIAVSLFYVRSNHLLNVYSRRELSSTTKMSSKPKKRRQDKIDTALVPHTRC